MFEPSFLSFMIVAFGLGLLHALDADHILTVSSLINTDRGSSSIKRSLRFCSHWALGHGFTILVIGVSVLILGSAIPPQMSQIAEHLVGLMLIALGSWTLYKLVKQNTLPSSNTSKQTGKHGALVIGCMHGLAGSAPILALVPLSQSQSPWQGIVYLLVFVLAVLIAMLVFGSIFSHSLKLIGLRNENALTWLRFCISIACIAIGVHLALL